MKKIYSLVLMLIALTVFQGAANAKEVSGTIAGTDAVANTLSLTTKDDAGAEQKVDIAVNAATTYAGAASLADLTVGQSVTVDASEDAATGGWSAVSVKVSEPAAQEPAVQ